MTTRKKNPAVESISLNYEEARDQLAQVAAQLERGGLTLEESLQLWEKGEELAAICEQWLTGAQVRIEKSTQELDSAED